MSISAKLVRELRDRTGAGMMDCKRALVETNGDIDKAIDYLRTKGLSDAAKKADRVAAEGLVDNYIHAGGRIGVLVEVNCETDFVAKTDEFKELCKDIALHICAMNPLTVSINDIDPDVIERERKVYIAKAKEEGKPDNIIDKIIVGQIKKFTESSALLTQSFVKNSEVTVERYIAEKIVTMGENIRVRRFVRYELGEGIEVVKEDFAEEVRRQIEG